MARLRVALLGCGGFQKGHARFYAACPDTELVAGCDVTRDIVEGFFRTVAPDAPPRPAYDDFATMLREQKPDAVVIATPHTLHFEHGMQALAAGCHVYMEKPMVTDAGQAYALAEKAQQTGRILVIGYNASASLALGYLREQIRSGALGRLQVVSAYMSQGWMKGTIGRWRQQPELSGGGMAYDSGAHLFNSLCWAIDAPVEEVHALVDNCGTPVDINATVNIRFEGGAFASVAIGGNCPSHGSFAAFLFEEGRIEIDPWSGTWIRVWRGKDTVDPGLGDQWVSPAQNFVDAMQGRAEPLTNPRHGIIQSELMDAIYASARTGQPARPVSREPVPA